MSIPRRFIHAARSAALDSFMAPQATGPVRALAASVAPLIKTAAEKARNMKNTAPPIFAAVDKLL